MLTPHLSSDVLNLSLEDNKLTCNQPLQNTDASEAQGLLMQGFAQMIFIVRMEL